MWSAHTMNSCTKIGFNSVCLLLILLTQHQQYYTKQIVLIAWFSDEAMCAQHSSYNRYNRDIDPGWLVQNLQNGKFNV